MIDPRVERLAGGALEPFPYGTIPFRRQTIVNWPTILELIRTYERLKGEQ